MEYGIIQLYIFKFFYTFFTQNRNSQTNILECSVHLKDRVEHRIVTT